MAIKADYHMHSSFSGDSKAPMEAMIERGIELGLTRLCFTEHMDFDYPYPTEEEQGMFDLNTEAYLLEGSKYKENYNQQIQLYFGVELGLQPHLTQELEQYVAAYDFDFIIGSSHICHRQDPYYPSFYEGRTEETAYREYFESILENIKAFHTFDVYGHLDYVVRYGPGKDREYTYLKYQDILDEILYNLIEKGKGIEVNTGGIPYGLRELNPCTDILRRYRELGGEVITVGSDAHVPGRIGEGFDRAADILTSCGFRYYTVFSKRKPEFFRI